jgi:uncharacterized protein (TIGR02118 family)
VIKTLALIQRRPDHSLASFREHYESVHAPLGAALLPLRGYVRSYPLAEAPPGALPFDALSEFWYDDEAAIQRVGELLAGERGDPLRADELLFMDKARNHSYRVEDVAPGTRPTGGALRAVAVLTLADGEGSDVLRARNEAGRVPAMGAASGPGLLAYERSYRVAAMRAPAQGKAAVGCVESFWFSDAAALTAAAQASLETSGPALVRVDERGEPWPAARASR